MHSNSKLTMIVVAIVFLGLNLGKVDGYMVNNNPYNRLESLDPRGNFQLEWEVDWTLKRVTFKVTVATRGYVGFGLSKDGVMQGADIVIGGVLPNRTTYFSDRHAVGNDVPLLDKKQDWKLLLGWENSTHTFLSFYRPFETCDSQDYPITENRIAVIWAYGETDDFQIYHHQNRGVFHVYLLQPDYSPQIIRSSNPDVTQIVGKENLKVWSISTSFRPSAEATTYWCTMYKGPRLPRKHHIVGFEVVFANEMSRKHTHHLLLYKCHAPKGFSASSLFGPFVGRRGQHCLRTYNPQGPMLTEYCTDAFQMWAVGGRAFFNPPHVGVALGESPDEYYMVQIHYDNPNLQANLEVDVRLDGFYTEKLRPFEGGIITVRSPSPGLTPSILVPPKTLAQTVFGMCGSQCTNKILPREGFTFSGILLHAHISGKRIRLHHFRNNEELPWIANDDNYAVNFQQFQVLQQERKILPGDQLTMRCVFDNTWTNETVVGGFASNQEMCIGFIFYHNKIAELQGCSSHIESEEMRQKFLGISNVTWNIPDIEYVADPGEPFAGQTVSEVSDNHVTWDLRKRDELQRMLLTHPQVGLCPKELFSSDARPRSLPRNKHGDIQNPDGFHTTVEYPFQIQPYQPKQTCKNDITVIIH